MPEQRPRYLPGIPLPPYTYVPGRSPHPVSDPRGHMVGVDVEGVDPPDPALWLRSTEYLRGVDLFNYGFYWEAHETWEQLWIATGRSGIAGDFLKGLIKLAAAGVKAREGNTAGVQRHMARAAELFQHTITVLGNAPHRFFGLDPRQLHDWCRQHPPEARPAADGTPVPVFDFLLTPES